MRRLLPMVDRINALESEFEALSDEALRGKTAEFRRRLGALPAADGAAGGRTPRPGRQRQRHRERRARALRSHPGQAETLDDLLPEAFAAVREASGARSGCATTTCS